MMKRLILCFGVLLLLAACSDTSKDQEISHIPAGELTKIEWIDDSNRKFIGKESMGSSFVVTAEEEEKLRDDVTAPKEPSPVKIPENPIIHALVNDRACPGFTIQEIQMDGDQTPALIFPNGATGVFSKGNGEGIPCQKGDKITWKFKKYPLDSERTQELAVGYIKDGVMYEAQIFEEKLRDIYQLDVPQNGIYHIYFLNLSSGAISLKEGELVRTPQNK